MLIRSGTNAKNARKESLKGGKDAVNMTPERIASNIL
jgi:hypothetical protein